jgi:hypothetical protein
MAKKKVTRTVYKRTPGLPDEEVAYRLVKLYFEDVARPSVKRSIDLDSTVNAYFYTLKRIENKEKELKAVQRIVEEEEEQMKTESKSELIPEPKPESKSN